MIRCKTLVYLALACAILFAGPAPSQIKVVTAAPWFRTGFQHSKPEKFYRGYLYENILGSDIQKMDFGMLCTSWSIWGEFYMLDRANWKDAEQATTLSGSAAEVWEYVGFKSGDVEGFVIASGDSLAEITAGGGLLYGNGLAIAEGFVAYKSNTGAQATAILDESAVQSDPDQFSRYQVFISLLGLSYQVGGTNLHSMPDSASQTAADFAQTNLWIFETTTRDSLRGKAAGSSSWLYNWAECNAYIKAQITTSKTGIVLGEYE